MKPHQSFLILMCLVITSCASPATKPAPHEQADASEFSVRFAAAGSISALASRDEAYASIAFDAVREGRADYAIKAIEAISATADRDTFAAACAKRFVEQHQLVEAKAIAELIVSMSDRDEVMMMIATASESRRMTD